MKTVGYLPKVNGEIVAGSKIHKNKGLAAIASNKIKRSNEVKKQDQLLHNCFHVLKNKFG